MAQAVIRIFVVREDKIQNSYSVDAFQVEIPYTFLSLILNGKFR